MGQSINRFQHPAKHVLLSSSSSGAVIHERLIQQSIALQQCILMQLVT